MPWRRPASLAARLWRGLAVFVLLIAAAGALIYEGVSRQHAALDTRVHTIRPLQDLNFRAQGDFAMSQASFRSYLLTRDPTYLVTYRAARTRVISGLARARATAPAGLRQDIIVQQQASSSAFGLAGRLQRLPRPRPPTPW